MSLIDPLHPCTSLGSSDTLDTLCESPGCSRGILIITNAVAKPDYLRFNLSAGNRERSPVLLPPEDLTNAGADGRKRPQKGGNPTRSVRRDGKWHTGGQN